MVPDCWGMSAFLMLILNDALSRSKVAFAIEPAYSVSLRFFRNVNLFLFFCFLRPKSPAGM